MMWLEAQGGTTPEELPMTGFVWGMVMVGMLLVGMIVILIVRKKSESDTMGDGGGIPFSLHDLRKLHEAGQLTDEEFEKARVKILAMAKAQLEKPAGKAAEKQKSIGGVPETGESGEGKG